MAPPRTGARARMAHDERRRASHSMEAVVSEAVALLDQAGEPALTFRALAARLGGGVASIYWYVSSKDELLDRASDHVLAAVLADTERFAGSADAIDTNRIDTDRIDTDRIDTDRIDTDPINDVRTIALTLFDALKDRPWLGAYFMRDTDLQPNALLLYERLGQQVMRLGLTPRQSFHAVSAVQGFVIGTAADLGQQPPQEVVDGTSSREEYIARFADRWRELDPETFPFVHHIVDEFAVHDDTDQFRAGLDLLLAGLRLQAAGPPA